jgi:RNA polymerase sigma factor (sigma-70 family)
MEPQTTAAVLVVGAVRGDTRWESFGTPTVGTPPVDDSALEKEVERRFRECMDDLIELISRRDAERQLGEPARLVHKTMIKEAAGREVERLTHTYGSELEELILPRLSAAEQASGVQKELLNDTYSEASKSMCRAPNDKAAELPWLSKILRTRFARYVESRKRHRNNCSGASVDSLEQEDLRQPCPDFRLQAEERAKRLKQCLMRCEPIDQIVLILFHCGDLPFNAIAAFTGNSYEATKRRLSRAREKLKNLLKDGEPL